MVNVVGLFIDHCIISDKISVFVKLMLCLLCMKILHSFHQKAIFISCFPAKVLAILSQ